MSTESSPLPEPALESQGHAAPAMSATRPFYWSVRRELWENRSITLGPLIAAALVLLGFSIRVMTLPHRMRALSALDPAEQHAGVVGAFSTAPAPIMLATFVIGIFYALDALYGERRDRSLLFWKSLPVSDLTTVLSKASIPLVVLPLIAFVLSVATVAVLLLLGTAVLLASGTGPGVLWAEYRFFQEPLIMVYGLAVHALWFAPIYGWLLLVSAWARRTPVLWAALPLFAISVVEKIAFNTTHFVSLVRYRVIGAMAEAFAVDPQRGSTGNIERLTQLDPLRFLSSPGLWIGLLAAVLFLGTAVRLRRSREPL